MALKLPMETWHDICTAQSLKSWDLANLVRTSRAFVPVARPALYRRVELTLSVYNSSVHTLRLLARDKGLAGAVVSFSAEEFWLWASGGKELVELLFAGLEKMVWLQEMRACGSLFAGSKGATRFLEILSQLSQLKVLKLKMSLWEVEVGSLVDLQVSSLAVQEWNCSIPDAPVQKLATMFRQHLVHLVLPFNYKCRLTASRMGGPECVEPPRGEVSAFLKRHFRKLRYVEHSGLYGNHSMVLDETPRCRLGLALDGETGLEFSAREMEASVQVACYVTGLSPEFVARGLEGLTLDHGEERTHEDRLPGLLWQLFEGTQWQPRLEATSLRTLVCRFNHRGALGGEVGRAAQMEKMLRAVTLLGGMCGQTLEHLSGILPPWAVPAERVARALTGFGALRTLGVYEDTVGSPGEIERAEYGLCLREACPSLESLEILIVQKFPVERLASPKWIVDVDRL